VSRTAFQCAAGLKPEDRPSRGHNPHQPAKPAAAVGSTSFLHNDETRQDFAGVLSLAVLKVKDVDDLRGKKLIAFFCCPSVVGSSPVGSKCVENVGSNVLNPAGIKTNENGFSESNNC
jgi:hypothetical protein